MLAGLDVGRALEHHVLEEVREPGPAGLLVPGPDVVPEVDGHGRGGVVGAGDHAQPVVEPVSVDRVRGDWHAPHGSVEIMVIADELLLLAIDDTTGKNLASGTNLDAALAAALLVELALSERISIAPAEAGWREKGKITVINTAPTDDPDLDAVLAKLASKDGQKVKNLISPMTWKPIS